MGYEVRFDICDVKIKSEHRAPLAERLARLRARREAGREHEEGEEYPILLACHVSIDEEGELCVDEDFLDEVVRRSNVEDFAAWVKPYCEAGGRIVIYSNECDGWAGGFVFDGNAKTKRLELQPVGRWS